MEQDKVYFEVRVVEPGRMLIGASRGFAVGVTRWSDGDSDARLQENSCCALNQADLPTCLEFFVNGASFATAHLRSTSLPPLLSIRSQGLQDSHAYSEPHWIES